jgi:serine kinase of HPr protein (carbohydrate metabolism regulator)
MDGNSVQVHGTSVELGGVAILLRGIPGSGKSDLALRLIDRGARLVADDRTQITREGRRLMASSPAPIIGLLEVRGVGIMTVASMDMAPLGLVVDLVDEEAVERLPEPEYLDILGLRVRHLRLPPFAVSTPAKLRLVVSALAEGIMPQ